MCISASSAQVNYDYQGVVIMLQQTLDPSELVRSAMTTSYVSFLSFFHYE